MGIMLIETPPNNQRIFTLCLQYCSPKIMQKFEFQRNSAEAHMPYLGAQNFMDELHLYIALVLCII
jgi:hypothetical protein